MSFGTNTLKSPVVDRNGNGELLRLLAMFFIVLHHFFVHGMKMVGDNGNPYAVFIDAFFMCRINVFMILSGYYGINYRFKGLWKLFSQCVFYGVVGYFLHLILSGSQMGKSAIFNCLFVFSSSPGWWFVQYYIYLYLFSPLLNYAIKSMNRNQFTFVLILLSVLNFYFAFLWNNPINNGGGGLFQFIYMYLLGRYLNLYVVFKESKNSSAIYKWLLCFCCSSALMGILAVCSMNGHSGNPLFNQVYNHPLVVLSAVFVLLAFVNIRIESRVVNFLSSSTLSIYLIHENAYMAPVIYGMVPLVVGCLIAPDAGFLLLLGLLIVMSLLLMIACVAIDKIRLIIMHPVDNWIVKKIIPLDSKLKNWLDG